MLSYHIYYIVVLLYNMYTYIHKYIHMYIYIYSYTLVQASRPAGRRSSAGCGPASVVNRRGVSHDNMNTNVNI